VLRAQDKSQGPRASRRRAGVQPGRLQPGARALLRLQRLAGNASVAELVSAFASGGRSPVLDVLESGRGQPLEQSVRNAMERRLGHDLGTVRVHTDASAGASARSVNADAYTAGEDIVFQSHAYRPQTAAGRRILAHELAHVIQQRSGPVSGVPAPGGIRLSEPSDPFEREAERVSRASEGDEARRPLVVGRAAEPAEDGHRGEARSSE
jgi:uncharacterized protein DUF4157